MIYLNILRPQHCYIQRKSRPWKIKHVPPEKAGSEGFDPSTCNLGGYHAIHTARLSTLRHKPSKKNTSNNLTVTLLSLLRGFNTCIIALKQLSFDQIYQKREQRSDFVQTAFNF